MKNIYFFFTVLVLIFACAFKAKAESKDVTMKVGDTETLYLPTSVTSKNLKSVTFYSNGINYVQVISYNNFSVKVKAIKSFSSPIIVRCDYRYFIGNGSFTYEASGFYDFIITVTESGNGSVESDGPTRIYFSSSAASVRVNESRQLSPVIEPANKTFHLTWSINDTSVATVDQNGVLTGKKEGYADLKVEADNGKYAMLRIVVTGKLEPESVTISPPILEMTEGDTKYLSASIKPSDAPQDVTWLSSDPSVATVSYSGKVTAIAPGFCDIKAVTSNSNVYAYCPVYVNKRIVNPISVSLSKNELKLKEGESSNLSAVVTPSDAEYELTWESSDETIATVTDGNVTAIAEGSCMVTVITQNGLKAKCNVTVERRVVLPESISLSKNELKLKEGESSNLSVVVTPSNAEYELTWESSDETIATVNDGKVTGIAEGSCTIMVSTQNGLKAECNVTVERRVVLPESISLSNNELKLTEGETANLSAVVMPSDAEYELIWKSSDETVATITDAKVTAIAEGSCTIMVSTQNGLKAECNVMVNRLVVLPESISLSKNELKLKEGESSNLSAVVTPSEAEYELNWESSDETIATVNDDKVTGIAEGSCTIIVSTQNGLKAECNVTVERRVVLPESISLSNNELKLTEGETANLSAVVMPSDAEYELIWKSSDETVATVTDGKVIGIAEGSCMVSVTTHNGLTAECNVTVERLVVLPESISLSKNDLKLKEGETANLSAVVMPSDAEYELIWKSSDETVATVNYGKVTGIAEGSCTIIVSTQNGLMAECNVTVENKHLSDIEPSLDWEGTYEMNAIVSCMEEDEYFYPTNFRMSIEKDTNGEYYVTSLIGFNILETYPYKGLKLNISSSNEAFVNLKENNDLGSNTEEGENYEGLHLLATSMQYSHENKGTVYLNRTSVDGISITDFNVFLFGLSTDFEYVLKAQYTNCFGKKIESDGIKSINHDSVETDLIVIYSLDGKLIRKCLENEKPMLNKGIYIIRKGNKTYKIKI